MIRFYDTIPEASAFNEIDGNSYGITYCRLYRTEDGRKSVKDKSDPRMLQVSFVKDGKAYLYLGSAGSAIAVTSNLPFSVSAVNAYEDGYNAFNSGADKRSNPYPFIDEPETNHQLWVSGWYDAQDDKK